METRLAPALLRDLKHDEEMNSLSSFKLAISSALCAALVGCASSSDTGPPTVVRTPPPRNYEKTVTDYLAFKIRNQPKNAEVSVGPPEPGACALDAYTTSSRGWVVPVAYSTRTGEATGKDTIRINTKQYYFWFLGNTIAGITPRIELCPGLGTGFEAPPAPVAATPSPGSASGEAQRREEADIAGPSNAASGQKPKTTSSGKAKKKSAKATPKPV
jgi:hypothetical protein